jgi:hypothetical protein
MLFMVFKAWNVGDGWGHHIMEPPTRQIKLSKTHTQYGTQIHEQFNIYKHKNDEISYNDHMMSYLHPTPSLECHKTVFSSIIS